MEKMARRLAILRTAQHVDAEDLAKLSGRLEKLVRRNLP